MLIKNYSPIDLFFNDLPKNLIRGLPSFDYFLDENEENYLIELTLPGLNKEDMSVNLEDDVLIVKHEKNEEESKPNRFRWGSFEKRFKLPTDVNKSKISGKYENGVLYVEIPKGKKEKKTIKIL